jgi:hypothetical protein
MYQPELAFNYNSLGRYERLFTLQDRIGQELCKPAQQPVPFGKQSDALL